MPRRTRGEKPDADSAYARRPGEHDCLRAAATDFRVSVPSLGGGRCLLYGRGIRSVPGEFCDDRHGQSAQGSLERESAAVWGSEAVTARRRIHFGALLNRAHATFIDNMASPIMAPPLAG